MLPVHFHDNFVAAPLIQRRVACRRFPVKPWLSKKKKRGVNAALLIASGCRVSSGMPQLGLS
jgi:hypothetical protein